MFLPTLSNVSAQAPATTRQTRMLGAHILILLLVIVVLILRLAVITAQLLVMLHRIILMILAIEQKFVVVNPHRHPIPQTVNVQTPPFPTLATRQNPPQIKVIMLLLIRGFVLDLMVVRLLRPAQSLKTAVGALGVVGVAGLLAVCQVLAVK